MAQVSDTATYVIPTIISLVGVVTSVIVTSFQAGARYGAMAQTMNTISERLARIEGLFEMKLKE
jgi:Flp pilus assembly protein protease CpaA